MKGSFIDEGYAELEGNDTLYVYGNAYEKILSDENLQKTIRKVIIITLIFIFQI